MRDAYRQEAELIGARHFPPLDRTLAELAAAPDRLHGCWLDSRLRGVIELDESPCIVDIAALCVAPACQRQGIGAALLRYALERADGRMLAVSTAAANHPALSLYEQAGFHRVRSLVTAEGIALVQLEHRAQVK